MEFENGKLPSEDPRKENYEYIWELLLKVEGWWAAILEQDSLGKSHPGSVFHPSRGHR